jgi:hypothetical protein
MRSSANPRPSLEALTSGERSENGAVGGKQSREEDVERGGALVGEESDERRSLEIRVVAGSKVVNKSRKVVR